jgi:minor extracellular serine protease Vpr
MKKRVPILLAAVALVVATIPMAGAQSGIPHPPQASHDPGFVNETPSAWFVQMPTAPAAAGGNRALAAQERQQFLGQANAAGLSYDIRAEYGTLFNGFSVSADAATVMAMSRLPGVAAIWPVTTIDAPDPRSTPDLGTALAMTGADIAQNELGLTGAGIKVAVMDTGIDYNHPDLGGCFGSGCRVITGHDFVGDAFNAADPANNVPMPDDDPMDCNGHGTHVAGIVGAEGDVTGVAPGVTFGAYKVFGCVGSTFSDIMISAMEMALNDGMDVLNMSIGSAFQWPQHPTAVASNLLVEQGMVVVASIGNNGPSGVYAAGSPGLGEKVIGVASFDNSHINALTFNVNPSGEQVAYLTLASAEDPPTEGESAEVVYIGRGCTATGGDTHLEDPAGKVALIVRGDCTFQEKYQGAADAGAVGVVIHNNVTGLFAGGGVTTRDIFGIGISDTHGLHIRSLLDGGETVTLEWTDVRVNAVNPTGGLISSFSSYGLAPDLSLKPDIGAPGGLIRSTYPLARGGYATVSGTSMSAPHVAGSVALLLEAKPGTAAGDVRGILMNSADPKPWWGNPGLGFLDNVHRQGAGMVDIPGAVLSTTTVSPEKLALGESDGAPSQTRTLTIRNDGNEAVTYALSHAPALGTHGNTFAPSFNTAFAGVSFSTASVMVPAGGSANVDVTISAPGAPGFQIQYGGYIVLTGDDDSTLRVPYAGFDGDYQSIVALNPTAFGFPLLATTEDEVNFSLVGEGTVFTMEDGDIPWVLYHLDHQVRELQFILEAVGGDGRSHPVHDRLATFEFMPRNSGPTSFFAQPFDGTRSHGSGAANLRQPVPNGDYRIVLKALKALGDRDNPDHWEEVMTIMFTIERPSPLPAPAPGRGRGIGPK